MYVNKYISGSESMGDWPSMHDTDAIAFALWVNSLDAEKIAATESFYSETHRKLFPSKTTQHTQLEDPAQKRNSYGRNQIHRRS